MLRRLPKILVIGGIVALVALLGAGQARTQSLDTTSTALQMSATSINLGDSVTFTATVTGTTAPVGTVNLTSQQNGGTVNTFAAGVALNPINSTQSQAIYTTNSFAAGSYTIVAKFRTSDSGTWGNSQSAGQILAVGAVVIHNTAMALNVNPVAVNQGDTANLVATVSTTDGSGVIPTGTVTFHSIQNGGSGSDTLLGTANLDGTGTATLPTGPWLAGSYTIIASYSGDAFDHAGGAQITLSVGDSGANKALTTTVVVASPQVIHTGDSTTFDAYVLQTGSTLSPPAGDVVEFKANGVFLGDAQLNGDGHAILTVGGWLEGEYRIEADYVGDLFFAASNGATTVSVTTPKPTTTTYTGGTSVVYGQHVTLSGHLVDSTSGAALGNQTLRIGVNAGHDGGELDCSGQTDASGNFSCVVTDTLLPGSYPIAVAFDGAGAYMPSGDNNTLVVSPISTTTTAQNVSTSTGVPTTISGKVVDQFGSPLPVGTPVTLTVPAGGETCTGTTDATGNVSCVITPSEGPGNWTITASFGGLPAYLASSGNGTMTIFSGIPTSLAYTGDTTVVQGHTAHVSFVLRNANTNQVLGNMPVTVDFDGGSYNTTSDASGNVVISPDPTVNDAPGSNLPAVASFTGQSPYLASQGTGNVFVTSPTSWTYTGPTSVTEGSNGGKTLISFVLKNGQGNVLPGMTVSLAFGSQTCSGLTTAANGSVSCLINTPAPGQDGGYIPTASFGGTTGYGASNGSGSFVVVAPTSLSYTGDTTGTRGGTATLQGVLTDSSTGGVLPGRSVTWTIGTGLGAQNCTATTDASGLASCTVTLSQNVSPTPYGVTGSFSGSAYYLASSASGALTMSPTVLTVTADNKSMAQGGAVPPLTYAVTGFVNGDTLTTSDVTGTATCTTTATSASPIGTYPIVCTIGSLASTNYTFRFVAGQISITPPSGCDKLFLHANKCESVIADPSPAQGSQVTPGQTMTIVYTDDSAMPAGGATVSLNGQLIPITVTTTSGWPQNYVDSYNGSMSTKNQSLISFQVPSNLANGQYSFIVTVYDGDGDGDQFSWNIGIGMVGQSNGGGGTTGTASSMNLADPGTMQLAGKALALSATLTTGTKALANEPVTFRFTSDSGAPDVLCYSKTNKSGVANCSMTPTALGLGDVIVTFAGDGTYTQSADAQELNIVSVYPTSLAFGTLPAFHYNKGVAVSATLLLNGVPFSGAKLTFTIGASSCTVNTNSSGVGSCNITPKVSGAATLTVSYAGDSTHAAATASQSITIANP